MCAMPCGHCVTFCQNVLASYLRTAPQPADCNELQDASLHILEAVVVGIKDLGQENNKFLVGIMACLQLTLRRANQSQTWNSEVKQQR